MNANPIEIYHPRVVSNHGIWDIGTMQFKVYGLLAEGKTLTDEMKSDAKQFLQAEVLDRVAKMGDSNDLGFIIIHPGDLGISIAAHWWVQGSVLCQHIQRQLYTANYPMDTVARPVIACVWELALINAEQEAWRSSMMKDMPDPMAYLGARPPFDTV
jgi:hypothetical protein